MTKKDYELIAKTLNKTAAWALRDHDSRATYEEIVRNLTIVLKKDNSKFNTSKFYDACGIHDK